MRILRSIALFLILVLIGLVGTNFQGAQPGLQPHTLTVCPQGSPACQFAAIQDAIQAAASDDLLLIQPGAYQENLIIDKSLRLIATETGRVYIQGTQQETPTLTLQTQEDFRVTLRGLIILGGPAPLDRRKSSCKELCSNGIHITGHGSLVLNLVDMQVNQAADAGLYCSSSNGFSGAAYVSIIHSSFTANTADGIAWIGCQFQETLLQLEQVDFNGSSDGLSFSSPSSRSEQITLNIKHSRFVGNVVGLSLGPMTQSQVVITDSLFLQNTGGGVIKYLNESSLEVRNSHFLGNKIGLQFADFVVGSPPETEDSSVRIENSSFLGNSLFGLEVQSPNRLTIQGNSIEGNGSGLWIELANNSLEISRNIIRRNREFGIALHRFPCKSDLPPTLTFPTFIQGEENEIRENTKGDLCPEDYNWPPNFRKP